MRRDGWTRGVLVLALVVAMIGILLPDLAYAQRNVTSRFDMTLGGYVQMNVTWDSDENTADGANNLRTLAVVKDSPEDGRETLRWGAFRTRLFMRVAGPTLWGAKSRAFIETDFDGFQDGNTAAHTPRMRHAYMRFDWPGWYLLVGQTTMLLTSAVGSQAELSGTTSGNRGDITGGSRNRAPQIQIGTAVPMGAAKLDLKGSIARNSAASRQGNDVLNDSGSRAVTPAVSGIAAATVKLFGRDAVFAVSGFWGEETLTSGALEADVNNTALALEWLVPIGPAFPGIGAFDFRGNWGTYENMSRVNLASDSSGVTSQDPTRNPSEIQSDGWWAEVVWEITRNFTTFVGMGRMEDDEGDLRTTGGTRVSENQGWWVAAQYTEGPFLFELLYGNVETTRLVTATGAETETDSQAIHLIFRYRF